MNLPNKITISRICLIPLVIFFYLADFIPYGKLVAALIFVIAALTDNIDGRIARKRNLVTDLGKFLDPIADKVLVMSGLLLIVAHPVLGDSLSKYPMAIIQPAWFGILCVVIILSRELIISAFRQIAATKNLVLAADKSGKVKAFFQDGAVFLYMVYAFIISEFNYAISLNLNLAFNIVLMIILGVTTILTVTSGIGYIVKNKHVLKSESTQKAPAQTKYDELIPDVLNEFADEGGFNEEQLEERFEIGQRRAKKIIDQMAKKGYISSSGETRDILLTEKEIKKIFGER